MKKKIFLSLLMLFGLFTITGCGSIEIEDTSNTGGEKVKAESKKLGDTISLDFVEVTLDSLEVKDNYEFSYTKDTSYGTRTKKASIEPKTSDLKLVTLRGSFTNKTSNEIYTSNSPMYGIFKITGNEYTATIEGYNTEEAEVYLAIAAQQKIEYFFYAEVPTEVADNITSCEVKFGFKKDLGPIVTDFSDLDYIYELKEIPTK